MKNYFKMLLIGLGLWAACTQCPAYTYPDHVLFGNYARTTLTEAIATNETDFSVVVVSNFPAITSTNEYYYLVVLRGTDNAKEVVKVTAADSTNNVLTVVRAQEGTTALTFGINDRVELWITADGLNDRHLEAKAYIDATVAVNAEVNTSNIVNYAVTAIKLATNAVTGEKILAGAIDETKLADGAVTDDKILDAAVITAKIADAGVTTAKLADANVTKAKIENVANMRVLGNVSGSAAAPAEVAILDQDDMASNSSTSLASQQSIKAYVDTAISSIGSLIGTSSNLNLTTVYTAATDGILVAISGALDDADTMIIYSDDLATPTTVVARITQHGGLTGGHIDTITVPILKGKKHRVTSTVAVTSIAFYPLGN